MRFLLLNRKAVAAGVEAAGVMEEWVVVDLEEEWVVIMGAEWGEAECMAEGKEAAVQTLPIIVISIVQVK